MTIKRLTAFAVLLAVAAAASVAAFLLWPRPLVSASALGKEFAPLALPADTTRELFDIGITDVNGDDRIDIYSTNHNTRQILWVADGRGGYRDMLTAWGLDQDPSFPGAEISDSVPEPSEPGVYIYWEGRNADSQFPLIIRTHRLKEIGRLDGDLQTYSTIRSYDAGVFSVQSPTSEKAREGEMARATLPFQSDRDGVLKVIVASPGVPITVRIGESIPLANIFVGPQRARPQARAFALGQSAPHAQRFELAFQDRHGMAWSDRNGDDKLDVFISRGAIGGTLRMFPASFQARIQDELLLSQPDSRYLNATSTSGIEKRGCSGRKVNWVDFDGDGRLDLFVNCMERGVIGGQYPKQLYRQGADGRFIDVAAEVGLALADHEIIDFVWADVDGDGDLDLVTYEATGFFLYRNDGGARFTAELIGRGKFIRAERPQLRGTADEYWFVDGKLAVADIDGDGDLDLFSASKTGNTLLINDGQGHFSIVDPASKGLPGESATANWLDFDNDGRLDLHAVPQGLFRQRAGGSFEATGLLALPPRKYMAAIVNWGDLDNDGRRDVVMALLENFSLWNWWERPRKTTADRFTWKLAAYRNLAGSNHWLSLRLAGGPGNPQAIGAVVTARTEDGEQTQVVGLNDGAFFSQGHYRLYFGLGPRARVEAIRVRWPDGQTEELRNVDADRLLVITQARAEKQEATK